MIGRVQVTRRRAGRAVLAVAVAAAAASVVYFGGQALGLDGSSADGLAFTISVPVTCETGQEDEGYGSIGGYDEDGKWVRVDTYGPFYQLADINTVELMWGIGGGVEPYEVSVQGQTLLSGQSGSTLVYCAESLPYDELDFTQPRDEYARTQLDKPPLVNPGPMTFRATVADANGLSATATTDMYIIPDCRIECKGDVLQPGYTYRIRGRLLTIPDGLRVDASKVHLFTTGCPEPAGDCDSEWGLSLADDLHDTVIVFGVSSNQFRGYWSNLGKWSALGGAAGSSDGDNDASHPQHDNILQFGASIGASPRWAVERSARVAEASRPGKGEEDGR